MENEKGTRVVERKKRGRPKKSQQNSSDDPVHLGKAHLICSVRKAIDSDQNNEALRSTTSRIITPATSQMVTRKRNTKVAATGPTLHDFSTDKQVKEMHALVSDSDSCARNVSKGRTDKQIEEWNRINPRLVGNHDPSKLNYISHSTRTIGTDSFTGKLNCDRKSTCRVSRTSIPQFNGAPKALPGESCCPFADPILQNGQDNIPDAASLTREPAQCAVTCVVSPNNSPLGKDSGRNGSKASWECAPSQSTPAVSETCDDIARLEKSAEKEMETIDAASANLDESFGTLPSCAEMGAVKRSKEDETDQEKIDISQENFVADRAESISPRTITSLTGASAADGSWSHSAKKRRRDEVHAEAVAVPFDGLTASGTKPDELSRDVATRRTKRARKPTSTYSDNEVYRAVKDNKKAAPPEPKAVSSPNSTVKEQMAQAEGTKVSYVRRRNSTNGKATNIGASNGANSSTTTSRSKRARHAPDFFGQTRRSDEKWIRVSKIPWAGRKTKINTSKGNRARLRQTVKSMVPSASDKVTSLRREKQPRNEVTANSSAMDAVSRSGKSTRIRKPTKFYT